MGKPIQKVNPERQRARYSKEFKLEAAKATPGSDTVLKIKSRVREFDIKRLPGFDHAINQMRQFTHHCPHHRLGCEPGGTQPIPKHFERRIVAPGNEARHIKRSAQIRMPSAAHHGASFH